MKSIVVASTNPVKIAAALDGFRRMFPEETFEARGVAAPSGVSDQPMTDMETLQGALNRVAYIRTAEPDADYWIGLEGGIDQRDGALECFAWIVATDGARMGKSRTATFTLPEEITRLVRQGIELGHADDVVFGRSNSKQQNGSVGLLTRDVINRAGYYHQAVVLALIPFRNSNLTF